MTGEAGHAASADLLRRAVDRYHELLAEGDAGERSVAYMRESYERENLIFGGRPLSPYLRPHFVVDSDWAMIRRVCESIWTVVQKVGAAASHRPDIVDELGLTDAERRLLAIDPGYDYVSPSARLDSFLTGSSYAFVELNAECPAGIAYADVATQIFLGHPVMKRFVEEFDLEPLASRSHMLETLLEVWHRVGKTGTPRIAIVDWDGLPTAWEFQLFKQYFESRGYPTTVADPRALTYEGGRLRHGDFEIDLVYKRLLTNDFLEHFDELHALYDAYRDRAICMVNSFRNKYVHKKMFFGVLTNERYADLFTPEEREVIRLHVPWTRRVADVRTEHDGEAVDLLEFVRENRERLVLKPNDDYGGHGVAIGWESDASVWDAAIETALASDYLVQERVPTAREVFPAIDDDGGWELAEQLVDLDPLLFFGKVGGAFTRLSTTSLCNVTSGGGMVPTIILKGQAT
jgi:hypothetical protein